MRSGARRSQAPGAFDYLPCDGDRLGDQRDGADPEMVFALHYFQDIFSKVNISNF